MEEGSIINPRSGRAKQIFASLIVALMSLHAGMIQGWQSPMSLKLKQDDSPVEKLDKDDIGILVTIPGYFGLVTAFMNGFLAQTFGRKVAMYAVGILSTLGGALVTFATSKTSLYIGRAVASIAGGALALAPMFISEIAHESIRGSLIALCTLQLNIGILVSYIAGAKLPYKVYNAILVILPAVYTVLLIFIPETPLFLADKSRSEDAKKSMTWYKGGDQSAAELELQRLTSPKNKNEENMTFGEILKSKVTRLAMIISVLGQALQVLSGIAAILNFAGIIFEEAGSIMSPDDSSIVIALILLGSSVINMFLMDKVGRKPLLYISFVGSAISLAILAVFLYIMKGADMEHLEWIPISSLSLFVITYGVGLAAVPGAILNEISPSNIKPTVGVVVMVSTFAIMMAVLQTFTYLDDTFGLYSVFVIPVAANVVGVFFTFFLVPETKGKTLVQIQKELKTR